MATESLRNLEAAFEAWNRGDVDMSISLMSEDVVWRAGGQFPGIEPVYEGHEAVRRFFKQFGEPWEEISIEIEEVIDDRDDQAVVMARFRARGRDGIEVDGRFFQIYRFDEQHLCRWFQAFAEEEKEEALREAGLADD